MCHNCGYSTTLGKFIKLVSPSLHKEYVMDQYKDNNFGGKKKITSEDVKKTYNIPKPEFKKKNRYEKNTIASLAKYHPARTYIEQRHIPKTYWNDLFYVEDFKDYVDTIYPNNEYKLMKNDPRVVIPFKSKSGILIAIQGRAIGDSDLRYITIKLKEELPKIYGMDRVNVKKQVYVVEGPFDSMFIPNFVAMGGADLSGMDKNTIFVFDNEKRNREIVNRMKKMLVQGYKVCIWPEDLHEKDINDMILTGKSPEMIKEIIDKNTYQGMKGEFKLHDWSR